MNKVFELTNKYIILGTPLILYSLISTVYCAVMSNGTVISSLIGFVLLILMTAAFLAGWLYMVKIAITDSDDENAFALLKEFPSGVGEYFLSMIGMMVNIFVITLILFTIAIFVGIKVIGSPNISLEAFNTALQSPDTLKTFLMSLSKAQLIKLNLWSLLLMIFMSITYLLEFLYIPAIFYKNKNPFVAFFISLKDLFSKKFFKTIGVFLLIFTVYCIVAMISSIFIGNVVMYCIAITIKYYFLILMAVGIFYYYYNNFIKSQLGQNIDTRV